MCAIILGSNMLAGQVRIYLGGADTRMTQQLLNVPQRRSTPQKVSREAVTKRMRGYLRVQPRTYRT